MKEEIVKWILNNDWLWTTFVGLITLLIGKFMPQFKFQRNKLEKKALDFIPDWIEPLVVKIYRTALDTLAQEMLKEVNGDETNLSTGLRSTMRDVKIALEEKVKSELKDNIKEKVIDLASKSSIELLEKAKKEIVNAEGLPNVKEFTMNNQTISIIDKLKDDTKNHVYSAYAELNKEDGKELEGKLGAQIVGKF